MLSQTAQPGEGPLHKPYSDTRAPAPARRSPGCAMVGGGSMSLGRGEPRSNFYQVSSHPSRLSTGTMNERSPLRRRLLENHFSFTALHRAKVIRQPDFVRWESPSEAFRCVLADSQSSLASLTSETSAVRTFPWTGDIAAGLENLGFRGTGCLRYMTLPPDRAAVASAASGPVDFQIRIAETETELGHFSDVQASSFLSPEPLPTGDDAAATSSRFRSTETPRRSASISIWDFRSSSIACFGTGRKPTRRRTVND